MTILTFVEFAGLLFLSYAFLIFRERNKSKLHFYAASVSIAMFLVALFTTLIQLSVFSLPMGFKLITTIHIIAIGSWLLVVWVIKKIADEFSGQKNPLE